MWILGMELGSSDLAAITFISWAQPLSCFLLGVLSEQWNNYSDKCWDFWPRLYRISQSFCPGTKEEACTTCTQIGFWMLFPCSFISSPQVLWCDCHQLHITDRETEVHGEESTLQGHVPQYARAHLAERAKRYLWGSNTKFSAANRILKGQYPFKYFSKSFSCFTWIHQSYKNQHDSTDKITVFLCVLHSEATYLISLGLNRSLRVYLFR